MKPPPIRGLTESLTDLSPAKWRTIVARLRRARLLAGEDPHNPGQLDTHPLVREYFGEQLRSQQTEAWKECNRRLYNYYRALAPQLPDNFREMEPLFLAVICGCNAGLCREALHEVYVPRIQRGNASFAANVLGAREALLSVLIHFFEHGRWESLVEAGVEGQSLTAEDQLFILMQAGLYLTTTRGLQSPEAHICYERAEPLCHSLHRPVLLYVALIGQWRYSLHNRQAECSAADCQTSSLTGAGAERRCAHGRELIGLWQTPSTFGRFRGRATIRDAMALRSGAREAYSLLWKRSTPLSSLVCTMRPLSEWHLGEIASLPSGYRGSDLTSERAE